MSEKEEAQLNIDPDEEIASVPDADHTEAEPEAEKPDGPDFVDEMDLTREIDIGDIFGGGESTGDFVDELDLTREIDLDDIFGDEEHAQGPDDTADLTNAPELRKGAGGVSDETLILSVDDLGEMSEKKDEEDLDKTVVLGLDDIPNPWRDEEDEVLDLFEKEGRTRVYPKDEDIPTETMVLDRKALKDELSEEEIEAEKLRAAIEAGAAEQPVPPVEGAPDEQAGKKKKHYKTHFFLKVLMLLAALIATAAFALSPVFTIRHVEVEGNKFYTDEQIINMSDVETGGNLFSDAQKSKIRTNLKDNLYFKTVRVKRRIPNTLVIEVEEREELAGVKYGDKYIVIDEDAVVLRIARLDPEVTEITGLKIMKMEPGAKIRVEEKKIFEDTLSTLHTMKEGDLFFKRIEIEDQTITAFIYDMLKVKGSSEDLRASIESGALQKVVNKLMKSEIERGTIILGEDGYISFSPAV
ncbi:MAG: FtsQ-type POTRA domain-containing protein [Eubacterium sp.]|nr:FtsQ-type POTRA domain-containing protein [Eubacterium sp.]